MGRNALDVRIEFNVPTELYKSLKELARNEERSLSAHLRYLIRQEIDRSCRTDPDLVSREGTGTREEVFRYVEAMPGRSG